MNEIRIYKKGKNKTIARMEIGAEVIIKGVARCNLKEDEYDFITGAEIALSRLKKKIAERRFRVKCMNDEWKDFTKGKIYEVRDGCIKSDIGWIKSFNYDYMRGSFKKIKEDAE